MRLDARRVPLLLAVLVRREGKHAEVAHPVPLEGVQVRRHDVILRVVCNREDDDRLEEIATKYSSGEMLTGEVKKELIGVLQKLVRNHQEKRAAVTDEMVKEFMRVRELEWED